MMAYPFAVYFGLGRFSPRIMLTGLLALLGIQTFRARKATRLTYLVGIVGVVIIATHSPVIGLRAYPVLISLTLAGVFGYSLIRPPSVIEQIVRVQRPYMPAQIVAYLRNVTIVWTTFFILNAAVSAATAVSGNMRWWALYNGFVSYLIIGALLVGEFVTRPVVDDLPPGNG